MTVVKPRTQFGVAELDSDDRVLGFEEKPRLEHWVNGGFFCFEPGFLDYLAADSVLEQEPLRQLAAAGQLRAFRHTGFWDCMDTYKDAVMLNDLWGGGGAPWAVWERDADRGRCPLARPWSPAGSGSSAPGFAGSCSGAASGSSRWTGPLREGRPSALALLGIEDQVARVEGDLLDAELLLRTLADHQVSAVFHLAAQTIVGVGGRLAGADLRDQRPRHLDPARGLPRAWGGARRRGLLRQGLRRP